MKTVILKTVTTYSSYVQNPQTSSIQFALLNRIGDNEFKELHYPVMCREYFGDAVVAAHLDAPVPEIYGFSLNSKRMAIDETLFSITLNNDNYEYFIKKLIILNKIEKKMNISLTQFFKTENTIEKNTGLYKIVSVGDKKWSSSPLLISIYTLILRSFSYKTNKRVFKNHIRCLMTNYGGNDVLAFREITTLIDLEHLLINIDKVLGLNPLTGINDSLLKERALVSPSLFLGKSTSTSLKFALRNKINCCEWSISNNHYSHGVLSFVRNLYLVSTNSSSKAIGSLWAFNYLILNK